MLTIGKRYAFLDMVDGDLSGVVGKLYCRLLTSYSYAMPRFRGRTQNESITHEQSKNIDARRQVTTSR